MSLPRLYTTLYTQGPRYGEHNDPAHPLALAEGICIYIYTLIPIAYRNIPPTPRRTEHPQGGEIDTAHSSSSARYICVNRGATAASIRGSAALVVSGEECAYLQLSRGKAGALRTHSVSLCLSAIRLPYQQGQGSLAVSCK